MTISILTKQRRFVSKQGHRQPHIGDLKIRRRQRERHKSNRFNQQNNNFARASSCFVHFFAVTARLRRENACLISQCTQGRTEEVHKRRRTFLSLSELEYGS